MAPKITIYSRPRCPLCDEALALCLRLSPASEIEFIDVEDDPALLAQYGECVPVLTIDGKERFRGKVSEVLLRRLLGRKP